MQKVSLQTFIMLFLLAIAIQTKAQDTSLVSQPVFQNTNTQTIIVKGKIIDIAKNEPLLGVNITVKGTTEGAITDVNGNFELSVSDTTVNRIIEISYLGYENKEFNISNWSKELRIGLIENTNNIDEVVVTSRRRKEEAQDIPIPISVISANQVENSGSFNVNRVKELIPSVQLYSSNPRNTSLNIRGLGTTFGLTNDGLDPGVGFYVDGVYYARPAATTLDFVDIQQIEVLRGPQGTLFGKNTTAGAFNITTRKPTFIRQGNLELSYGNYQFVQGKVSISGPIVKDKLAARISFSGTHRNGLIKNINTGNNVNNLSNISARIQLLYKPIDKLEILVAGDFTAQRPDGYAQVNAGVVPTQRAGYRQFDSIIAALGYTLPTQNPFDRIIDHDTPAKSGQNMGGFSVNIDYKLGKGTLTSTTALRFWKWMPSTDRDFTGLQALALSQAPSKHKQWSQEFRYAATFSKKLSGVFGMFLFGQKLRADGFHQEESGKDTWRFVQSSTSALWKTPGLFEGYGLKSYPSFDNFSGALFAQVDWEIFKGFRILPGLRLNYDKKSVDFRREVYGGLETTNAALLALKNSVYSNQAFKADASNFNASGQLTVAYSPHKQVKIYATYANTFKPIGLNLGGLPTDSTGVLVDLAKVKPELTHHFEFGLKTEPIKNSILNVTTFFTQIKNYQTLVQTPDLTLNRGYLANADKIRIVGLEIELSYRFKKYITVNGGFTFTDGKYLSFKNAPLPLEETGARPAYKDISGGVLPGISKYITTFGIDAAYPVKLFTQKGEVFFGMDTYYRSKYSSSPSPSKYLNIDGYFLLNARIGFRAVEGFSIFVWSRNLTNKNYFEQLLPGAGNPGNYAGVLGDQRTFGATIKYAF
ncbi:MAG TPA: TonB-dependent receptor [Chitinophagales bacterium]|nr:TonB-dependent receptor [Chitinophagales bacterium]